MDVISKPCFLVDEVTNEPGRIFLMLLISERLANQVPTVALCMRFTYSSYWSAKKTGRSRRLHSDRCVLKIRSPDLTHTLCPCNTSERLPRPFRIISTSLKRSSLPYSVAGAGETDLLTVAARLAGLNLSISLST